MDYNKINNYYSSMTLVMNLYNNCFITLDDVIKSEQFFARKYCIKADSIYRLNDLINRENNVIYSPEKKV